MAGQVDPELEELIQTSFDPYLTTRSDVKRGEVTRETWVEYVAEVYAAVEATFRAEHEDIGVSREEYALYVQQLLDEQDGQ